jgi:hypothetical protein
MVTTSINQVLNIAQNKQIQFFKIFDATGKQLIYTQDDEDTTPAEAYNELNEQLKNFDTGIVAVQLSEKSYKEKGQGGSVKNGAYFFKVRVGQQNLTPAINGLLSEDVKSLMNEVAELRLKLMLQEQEHKNAENQRKLEEKIEGLKNNDPFEKYAPTFLPILSQMFGTPTTPQITPNINGTETTIDDKKTIITKAVNRLIKIDPNFAENLTLLADFGEKNPEKYKSFIPMLKVM